jgi:hypothetical protein
MEAAAPILIGDRGNGCGGEDGSFELCNCAESDAEVCQVRRMLSLNRPKEPLDARDALFVFTRAKRFQKRQRESAEVRTFFKVTLLKAPKNSRGTEFLNKPWCSAAVLCWVTVGIEC